MQVVAKALYTFVVDYGLRWSAKQNIKVKTIFWIADWLGTRVANIIST